VKVKVVVQEKERTEQTKHEIGGVAYRTHQRVAVHAFVVRL
jgi:hypothetical protein